MLRARTRQATGLRLPASIISRPTRGIDSDLAWRLSLGRWQLAHIRPDELAAIAIPPEWLAPERTLHVASIWARQVLRQASTAAELVRRIRNSPALSKLVAGSSLDVRAFHCFAHRLPLERRRRDAQTRARKSKRARADLATLTAAEAALNRWGYHREEQTVTAARADLEGLLPPRTGGAPRSTLNILFVELEGDLSRLLGLPLKRRRALMAQALGEIFGRKIGEREIGEAIREARRDRRERRRARAT